MDPSDDIAVIETNLRGLVATIMKTEYGVAWTDQLPAQITDRLNSRQVEEAKRRAPAGVSSELLDYTHLYEILEVVRKHWELFKPALGTKKDFDVLMGYVEDYRNAPAHSRTLLPWEREHLSGIAGIIRTKVTVYRSSKGPDMEYYPVIERVRDSFGNEVAEHDEWTNTARPGLTLNVGDVVEFECAGWDPHGRELIWNASIFRGSSRIPDSLGTGPTLTWTVAEGDVSDSVTVFIYMRSTSKYHRENTHDDVVGFEYRVLPPSV